MKQKASIITSIAATILFLVIQYLYCFSSIASSKLDITSVIFTLAFIATMFIIKIFNKNENIVTAETPKSTITGLLAMLASIAMLIDSIYQLMNSSDLENKLHHLITDESIKYMYVSLIIRCILGIAAAIVLFIFGTSFFSGTNKIKKFPIIMTVPSLWGCSKLIENIFIKAIWMTTASVGISIVGEIFLLLAIFSMTKIFIGENEKKNLKQFTFFTFTALPIIISSSAFGIYNELQDSTKSIFLYITEIILVLFIASVYFISKDQDHESTDEIPSNVVINSFEWTDVFVSTATLISLIFAIFFRTSVVSGESMSETLHDKDRLILYSFMYTPKAGDIVVINPLQSMVDHDEPKERIIKRIIATGGQTLKIDFKAQKVYVDGKELDESYTSTPMPIPYSTRFNSTYGRNIPSIIPEGYVFVMGDNRGNSLDSRFDEVGLIREEDIVGKAIFRIWPERFGILK